MSEKEEKEKEVTLLFRTPISFTMEIGKIEVVTTKVLKRVWIEGIGKFGEDYYKTKFYCPSDLEFFLRDMEIKVGDVVDIKYLGKIREKGIFVEQYHIERITDGE